MLSQLAVAPVNHLLRAESWALRRLQPHVGRTARFEVFPFYLGFTVRDDGQLAAAGPDAVADATFRLTPPAALRILAGDQSAYDQVTTMGDPEFAQAVEFVVRNVRWDFEEDLSRVLGDSTAHRIAGAAHSVRDMHARVADSVLRNLSDYWLEERPLIARRADIQTFVQEVDTLRDDVERLAQRIAQLDSRQANPKPHP